MDSQIDSKRALEDLIELISRSKKKSQRHSRRYFDHHDHRSSSASPEKRDEPSFGTFAFQFHGRRDEWGHAAEDVHKFISALCAYKGSAGISDQMAVSTLFRVLADEALDWWTCELAIWKTMDPPEELSWQQVLQKLTTEFAAKYEVHQVWKQIYATPTVDKNETMIVDRLRWINRLPARSKPSILTLMNMLIAGLPEQMIIYLKTVAGSLKKTEELILLVRSMDAGHVGQQRRKSIASNSFGQSTPPSGEIGQTSFPATSQPTHQPLPGPSLQAGRKAAKISDLEAVIMKRTQFYEGKSCIPVKEFNKKSLVLCDPELPFSVCSQSLYSRFCNANIKPIECFGGVEIIIGPVTIREVTNKITFVYLPKSQPTLSVLGAPALKTFQIEVNLRKRVYRFGHQPADVWQDFVCA